MKIFDLLKGVFSTKRSFLEEFDEESIKKLESLNLQRLAIMNAISLIAFSVSKYSFNFYKNGIFQFDDDWYIFNYEPNRNQNKQQFFYDFIFQLAVQGRSLVIKLGNEYFVADSFLTDYGSSGFAPAQFWNVSKDGKMLQKTFAAHEVLYCQFDNAELNRLLISTANEYSDLLCAAGNKFRNSAYNKGILKIDTQQRGSDEEKNAENERINKTIKSFFSDTNAVLPLKKNMNYEELGKYRTASSSEDVSRMTEEIYSLVAKTFGIPTEILLQKTSDNAHKARLDFYNNCVEKYINLFVNEGNRKLIGREWFIGKNGVQFRMDATAPADKDDLLDERLFNTVGSGVASIDELREQKGLKPLGTEWSTAHYISKNLTQITHLDEEESNE